MARVDAKDSSSQEESSLVVRTAASIFVVIVSWRQAFCVVNKDSEERLKHNDKC